MVVELLSLTRRGGCRVLTWSQVWKGQRGLADLLALLQDTHLLSEGSPLCANCLFIQLYWTLSFNMTLEGSCTLTRCRSPQSSMYPALLKQFCLATEFPEALTPFHGTRHSRRGCPTVSVHSQNSTGSLGTRLDQTAVGWTGIKHNPLEGPFHGVCAPLQLCSSSGL